MGATTCTAKTLNIDRLRDNMANQDAAGSSIIPQYDIRAGDIPLAKIGGVPIFGGLQTQQQAAEQTIQPLVDIAAQGLPAKYRTQAGAKGGMAGLVGNVGGLPGGAAKAIAETATGTDLFTGAPIKGSEKQRLLNSLIGAVPRGKQYESSTKDIVNGTAADRTARILALLGGQGTAVTPKRQTGEIYRRTRAAQDAAELQGLDTLTALKKKGKKPKKSKG
jgi:hypothetical protein